MVDPNRNGADAERLRELLGKMAAIVVQAIVLAAVPRRLESFDHRFDLLQGLLAIPQVHRLAVCMHRTGARVALEDPGDVALRGAEGPLLLVHLDGSMKDSTLLEEILRHAVQLLDGPGVPDLVYVKVHGGGGTAYQHLDAAPAHRLLLQQRRPEGHECVHRQYVGVLELRGGFARRLPRRRPVAVAPAAVVPHASVLGERGASARRPPLDHMEPAAAEANTA
mmetsp:Transcript_118271/g.331252  ORF Transcript_118271/g.331252 Transcript_118271/m.331252 type:complete len:223 (+) Transcript_118271:231-899(+)